MGGRGKTNVVWRCFDKNEDYQAVCKICNACLSYRTTTGNLRNHLYRLHQSKYRQIYGAEEGKEDVDEDSNSSMKFSSEIWSYFETEGDTTRCSLCQQETANTVEDMRAHLEDDHPALMIGILNKKTIIHSKDDDDATDDERAVDPIEEEVFTDVLYLDEEKPKPAKRSCLSRTVGQKSIRTFDQRTEPQTQKIEYVIQKPSESRPEIDAFLTYIGVLLKNVPKETIPKLQLEIISSILKAQMENNTASSVTNIIPVSNTVTIPVTSENLINNGGIVHNETAKYHITIDNGLVQKSP